MGGEVAVGSVPAWSCQMPKGVMGSKIGRGSSVVLQRPNRRSVFRKAARA
jgi:hypothetical protein